MAWKVQYSETAYRFISKLDRKEAEVIYRKIGNAKADPHHFFIKMVSLPLFKLRVGDYRIIADLKEQVEIIAVIRVGHRKNIYKDTE